VETAAIMTLPAHEPVSGNERARFRRADDARARSAAAGLYRLALGLTGRADEAEELAQQAALRILSHDPEKLGHTGYGRTVVTRLWLDRQRGWRRGWSLLSRAAWASARWFTPPDAAEADEGLERIRAHIDALPPVQRAVLTLRLVEGMTCAQIARALGRDEGAVRASLHLARKRVRRAMESGPAGPGSEA
jgi:RNA polymerase sigma-70 factor (ECF subfamily)